LECCGTTLSWEPFTLVDTADQLGCELKFHRVRQPGDPIGQEKNNSKIPKHIEYYNLLIPAWYKIIAD